MAARGASWRDQLKQPKTWASLLVLLLVGGLWLFSELDTGTSGTGAGPAPAGSSHLASSSPTPGSTITARPSAPPARSSSAPSSPGAHPSSSSPTATRSPSSAAPAVQDPSWDPESGLDWIDAGDLPREGQEILVAIDNGGPFVREKDGSTFGNYEGVLPSERRGYYAEYTVPTPGVSHAGARRIITGDGGEYYWTEDHYESFERIRR